MRPRQRTPCRTRRCAPLNIFPSFRGSDGRAWLLQIVRNAAYDRLATKHGNEIALSLDDNDASRADFVRDHGDDPETALVRKQDRARLDALLASLPVELREAVVLCDLEELSYRDIAQVTGAPIGTVMSRLWRGRGALRRAAMAGEA
jgi:RNA polymerase sigma-70 factor, ECF subfamily